MTLAAIGITVALLAVLALGSDTAEAHRDGCHRWHSCPSDTGSYTCGDLGYTSECGEALPDAGAPNVAPSTGNAGAGDDGLRLTSTRIDVNEAKRQHAQSNLDGARAHLVTASGALPAARTRAHELAGPAERARRLFRRRQHAARRARLTADAAVAAMVRERRDAQRLVDSARVSYRAQHDEWEQTRDYDFGVVVVLALLALILVGWSPLVAWLRSRRSVGLTGGKYALAVAFAAVVVAAVVGLGLWACDLTADPVLPLILALALLGWFALRAADNKRRAFRRRATRGAALGVAALVAIISLADAVSSNPPRKPSSSETTLGLARLASSPDHHPTARVRALNKRAVRLERRAAAALTRSRHERRRYTAAAAAVDALVDDLHAAKRSVRHWTRAVAAAAPRYEALDTPGSGGDGCNPNYSGACLDPDAYDYDCQGGSGDGPDYTGPVEVVGDDPYGLDRDGDGYACE